MNNIERFWLRLLCLVGLVAVGTRAYTAFRSLTAGDNTAFLSFPLSVILPSLAFVFVIGLRDMASQEGALMQLGVLIQLVLIVTFPSFALCLVLGFPVVFLVVELFETRMPIPVRDAIKRWVLT